MTTTVPLSHRSPPSQSDFEYLSSKAATLADPMIGDAFMNVRDTFMNVNQSFRALSQYWPFVARLESSPGSALHCYKEQHKGLSDDFSKRVRDLQQMVVKLVASARQFGNLHSEKTTPDNDDFKIDVLLWALSKLLWQLVDFRRRAEIQVNKEVITAECFAQNDGRGCISLTYLPKLDSVTCILRSGEFPESRILLGPRVTTVTMRDLLGREPEARRILCQISHSLNSGGVVFNISVEPEDYRLGMPDLRLGMPKELRLYGRSGHAEVCLCRDDLREYAEPNICAYESEFVEFSELEWIHFR